MDATSTRPESDIASNTPSTLEGANVLVVDDDPSIHLMTKGILKKFGFISHNVQSAFEAIEYLDHSKPDLIMSDIFMPVVNGMELCTCLKGDERWKDIPFLFFTADSEAQLLSKAFDAGACDFLTKPLRAFEIGSRVQHHISQYRKLKAGNERIHLLDTKNKTMTKFLGIASHDLRNPLISIRGLANHLKSDSFGELNATQTELVDAIQQSSDAMLDLVDNLLEVARFKRSLGEISKDEVNIINVLNLAKTLHSGYAKEKGTSIRLDAPQAEENIFIDRKLISRLIDNLISNAIKFSPPNSLVSIILTTAKDSISISIEDEGPGIPQNEFELLFKEFSRTSNRPTAGESSNGLGLYVCQQIAKAHGGLITAKNRLSKGANFTVTLPRNPNNE